ncbi:MAG TPA: hypothetical protein VLB67_09880 [Acidimicrobiia bacterium]|nr:hypothetical protein [Acidimicrobiia bacterium]
MRLLIRDLRDGVRGMIVETMAVAAAILLGTIVAVVVLATL